MAVPNSHTIAPHLIKLPYDPLRDFTPITLAVQVPHVLVVSQSSPVEQHARAGRAGEGESGQAQLLLVGRRRHAAPGGRAVQSRHRREDGAHSLQGQRRRRWAT